MSNPMFVWFAEPASAAELLRTTVELDLAGVDAVVLPAPHAGGPDPMLLASAATRRAPRLGLIAELSPWTQPPFLTARALNTLDALSGGRAGWLVSDAIPGVTGIDDSGRWFPSGSSPAERREALADYLAATSALWNSWEPDSIVADVESGRYVDAAKVHPVHYRGPYYSTRGPLNAPRAPQGRPVRMARFDIACPAAALADVLVVESESDVAPARRHASRVLLIVRPVKGELHAMPATAADGYAIVGVSRADGVGRALDGLRPSLPRATAGGLLRDRLRLPEESFAYLVDPLTLIGEDLSQAAVSREVDAR
jgi:alkanesulfonate monooxygenase SsuD/methylene tetrahydromethanopterin reductase-like flavin-dependent oxidoreductase (luciferase family)